MPLQPNHRCDYVERVLEGKMPRVPGMADAPGRHAERAAGDIARRHNRQQHHLAQRERDEREVMAKTFRPKHRKPEITPNHARQTMAKRMASHGVPTK